MAENENVLMTRIQLKYDTLANWNSSTIVLKRGEVAIAEVPQNTDNSGLMPPAIGIKVGNGVSRFSQLPWIQAAAGDVYAWAKAANKPSYQASEIQGLEQQVQAYVSGSINDTNTTYKIEKGTGDNQYNYILYKHEATDDPNTWTYVSLLDTGGRVYALEEWIGSAINEDSLANAIGNTIATYVNTLSYTDNPVEGQFIYSVNEANGKITTVGRRAITAADITRPNNTAALSVNVGGTGRSELDSGKVLIGNGTGAVNFRDIETVEPTTGSNYLITSDAVRNYVDSEIATVNNNLTRVMHFRGIANNPITTPMSDPGIANYPQSKWEVGDVIIYIDNDADTPTGAEYVWTGPNQGEGWQLLGDEGSWIVHGSVINSDIAANANISQSKIAGLTEALAGKVNVDGDKVLSDENYTSTEKTKLANIESGAEVNILEKVYVQHTANSDPEELTITNKSVTIDLSNVGQVKGAEVPTADNSSTENVTLSGSGKLQLARIAKTGDIADLQQPLDEYERPITVLVLNCGNASTVI